MQKNRSAQSSAQIGVTIILIASAMVGAWGLACLVGGVSRYGVVEMIKGWFSAVMGG